MSAPLPPDTHRCRNCGNSVVYAYVQAGRTRMLSASYDAEPVANGGYHLEEEETPEGEVTGNWIATYVKVADRNGADGHRKHDCPAKYNFQEEA